MIITDYYRFERLQGQKSKLRIDCVACSGGYPPLEGLRNRQGALFLYLGDNSYTKAGNERKADLALSRTSHISSIYNPDINLPYWYGDFNHTTDAMLFIHEKAEITNGEMQTGAVIECFVCRGQRNNRAQLYNALCDGLLDDEIEAMRKASIPESKALL